MVLQPRRWSTRGSWLASARLRLKQQQIMSKSMSRSTVHVPLNEIIINDRIIKSALILVSSLNDMLVEDGHLLTLDRKYNSFLPISLQKWEILWWSANPSSKPKHLHLTSHKWHPYGWRILSSATTGNMPDNGTAAVTILLPSMRRINDVREHFLFLSNVTAE